MASKARPTDEDRGEAVRLGLFALRAGQDLNSIMEQLAALHPRK
jgi:hypothetical protein